MRDYLTFDRDEVGSSLRTASRCQIPTVEKSDGGCFSVWKEDMELKPNTQEPQDNNGNLQSLLNFTNDLFILKFPPEIASHILFSSMDAASYDSAQRVQPRFFWGPSAADGVCWHGQHLSFGQRSHLVLESRRSQIASLNSKLSVTGCSYLVVYH